MKQNCSKTGLKPLNLNSPARWIFWGLYGLVICYSNSGNAQSRTSENKAQYAVNRMPQPLYLALNEFAEKSGIQFVYDAALVEGLLASDISKAQSNQQALSALLKSSGISYRFTGPNTIVLYRPEKATENNNSDAAYLLPVVQVTADAKGGGNEETLPKITVDANADNPYDDPSWQTDPYNTDYVLPKATVGTKTNTPVMETPLNVQVISKQVLKDQQVIRLD